MSYVDDSFCDAELQLRSRIYIKRWETELGKTFRCILSVVLSLKSLSLCVLSFLVTGICFKAYGFVSPVESYLVVS